MFYLFIKSALSGVIIMLVSEVSEVAKRSTSAGALIASLPLVSVLGMLWLWRDTHDVERLAAHSSATFWYVLPSLPMFLVLPLLLRSGIGFYAAMAVACLMTMLLYVIMVYLLGRFSIHL